MKVGIISDIHGNLVALDAVLSALDDERLDEIVCLGDVALTGPQPRESLARLQALGCPVVMGNVDAWALAPAPFTIRSEDDQILYDIERWGAAQLTDDDRAFIGAFQPTVELALDDGRRLLCFHGSPRSNTDTINANTPDDTLAEMFAERAEVMAGGHTHMPLLRRFGSSFLLNPGSVGMPYIVEDGQARNLAWAEYAIVDANDGRLAITFHPLPYDLADLRDAVQRSGMPHVDAFLKEWAAS